MGTDFFQYPLFHSRLLRWESNHHEQQRKEEWCKGKGHTEHQLNEGVKKGNSTHSPPYCGTGSGSFSSEGFPSSYPPTQAPLTECAE